MGRFFLLFLTKNQMPITRSNKPRMPNTVPSATGRICFDEDEEAFGEAVEEATTRPVVEDCRDEDDAGSVLV